MWVFADSNSVAIAAISDHNRGGDYGAGHVPMNLLHISNGLAELNLVEISIAISASI